MLLLLLLLLVVVVVAQLSAALRRISVAAAVHGCAIDEMLIRPGRCRRRRHRGWAGWLAGWLSGL